MIPLRCPACNDGPVIFEKGYIRCTSCAIYANKLALHKQPFAWAENRNAWVRLPALVLLLYIFLTSRVGLHRSNPISMLDLGMHELGHVFFRPFGEFMAILGGSLFQCLFPILWFIALWLKRWYFGASLMLIWLGINLWDVSLYIADAQARLLPLATFNSDYDSAHDWYQILLRTDNLHNDAAIAHVVQLTAYGFVMAGSILAAMLLFTMIKSKITMPKDPNQPHI